MFNIFKPELIQFGDGKFAIRKNRLFHYLYMDESGYWWVVIGYFALVALFYYVKLTNPEFIFGTQH